MIEPILLRAVRQFARGMGILEGWLGVLFSTSIALGGLIGALPLFGWRELTPLERLGAIIWTIGWVCLDVPYLFRLLLIAIRKRHPFALTAAIERHMYPPILRLFIAVWWFAHFGWGAAAASMVHAVNRGTDAHWGFVFLACGMSLAANGFLMLSVCAATSSRRIRMGVWKSRILIDLASVLAGAVIAGHLSQQPDSAKPLRSPTGIATIGR